MKLRYARRWLAACALAALAVGPALTAEQWVVKGRVVGVADGDTITILDLDKRQHKIRFNGIDAPEKGQASGLRSKENVRAECHK